MEQQVLLDRSGGIATITLNRPDRLNAFAGTMRTQLLSAVESVAADLSARVLIITGAGRAFCAGGDIDYMADLKQRNADFCEIGKLMDVGRRVVLALRSFDRPVIAAVNGPATGAGLNLALACDLRIASEAASLGATFSRIGLMGDWGGTYFLPRLVGTSAALRMFWTGDVLKADEALRLGLVDQVVPADDHRATVNDLARRLADAPPTAVEWAKRAVYRSNGASLRDMLMMEMEAQQDCWESEDSREGIRAFVEKRKPEFTKRSR